MTSLVVRGQRVVLPDGVRPVALHVVEGRIAAIAHHDHVFANATEVDAEDLVVMPGLVDSHVHINDPGRAHWEGFDTATRAAAAGGVTTLVDMPLNSIPATTTVAGLEAKKQAATGHSFVDVAFWGGVIPGNATDLEPLARAGVRGFKAFLSPSGVDEFPHVTESDLREALPILARLDLPLLVHAEWPASLLAFAGNPCAYATWLASRPAAAEVAAIDLLARLAGECGARIHIVHLASAEAVRAVMRARASGVAITGETCPHYLTFAAEDIVDAATAFKCAPPIRERAQREALWQALREDRIDLVATDHSPAPPSMKCIEDGDFARAWGGIASLQIGLAATWTGARERGIPFETVIRWMSAAPSALAGLTSRKGSIAVGADADLVFWDPDARVVVDPAALHHRHPVTPYAGMTLVGAVKRTILRGETVFLNGEVLTEPLGKVIA
jgi:allantoinase